MFLLLFFVGVFVVILKYVRKKPLFGKIILIILIKVFEYAIIAESIQLKGGFYTRGGIYEKAFKTI